MVAWGDIPGQACPLPRVRCSIFMLEAEQELELVVDGTEEVMQALPLLPLLRVVVVADLLTCALLEIH